MSMARILHTESGGVLSERVSLRSVVTFCSLCCSNVGKFVAVQKWPMAGLQISRRSPWPFHDLEFVSR